MNNKFTLITVNDQALAKIIAKMLYHQYRVEIEIQDSTAFSGFNINVDDDHADQANELTGFARGVRAVLGSFFNL